MHEYIFEQAAIMTDAEADFATLQDIQQHIGQFATAIDILVGGTDEV